MRRQLALEPTSSLLPPRKVPRKWLWRSQFFFTGGFAERLNPATPLTEGQVFVYIHKRGIKIVPDGRHKNKKMKVYWESVFAVESLESNDTLEVRGNAVMGAMGGGLLFGGTGAIVGAITANAKNTHKWDSYLRIGYWHPEKETVQTLVLLCDAKYSNKVISFYQKYGTKRLRRKPQVVNNSSLEEKQGWPTWVWIILTCVFPPFGLVLLYRFYNWVRSRLA